MKKLTIKLKNTFFTSRRLLRMLWEFDKKLFVGNLLVISIPAIVPFINAYIYKLIIDVIVVNIGGGVIDYRHLVILIGLRLFTLVLQDISFSLQSYYDSILWTKFPNLLYQEVLTKLSNLDIQQFENSEFKNRLEKVRESYTWKPLNMLSSIFFSFQSFLQFSIALTTLIILNWLFVIPLLLVAVFSFFIQTRFAEVNWGIWSSQSTHRKKFWYLSDLIQGGSSIKEIKIFQLAPNFLGELQKIYYKFVEENVSVAKKQFLTSLLLNITNVGIYIGIEIFVILSALVKKISIGSVTYYSTVVLNFQNGVNGLFRNFTRLFDNSQYVKEMFDLMDTSPQIKISEKSTKVDLLKTPLIEFKNVSFKYPGTKVKVLNNFSLTVKPGQKIAFVGENGAGKTTIIKLLARFYDVSSGEILINGINIKEIDLNSWYKCLGVLFQDYIKYEYPLSDNIYFGKIYSPKNMSEIISAAKRSGADLVADKLPKGYSQMLGKTFDDGVELSTGQWQKVALARGFLRNAPILILDEPTAAIDARAETEIFKKVEELASDKTVIIISHRFSTVRNADIIYVIENGKIAESGSHKKLVSKKGIYAELFELQSKGYR